MAFTSDVENALVILASTALYPQGVTTPGLISPVAGALCHVSRGWPLPTELDAALAANEVLVTVWPETSHTRLVDGYIEAGFAVPGGPSTLSLSVAGPVVTLSGTPTAGQLAGLRVDGEAFGYVIQGGDDLVAVATALAALANGDAALLSDDAGGGLSDDSGILLSTADFAAVSAGPPVTIALATNRPIDARTAINGLYIQQYRWQEQRFRVIVWAPSAAARDAALNGIDVALVKAHFIALPDSPMARMLWQGTERSDVSQKADLYRGDLCYMVRFATTAPVNANGLLWGDLELHRQTSDGRDVATVTTLF